MKVFILHGWAYSTEKWKPLCDLLVSKNIEPVILNIPGLTEPSSQVWDMLSYLNWLEEKLHNEPKPVLIGHSNGGRIALAYAQRDPKRPGQLVLIDSAGVAHNDGPDTTKRKIFKLLAKLGKPLGFIPGIRKIFYSLIGAMDYYYAPPNMKKTMQNMLDADASLDPAAINVPITLIWGDQDKLTPIEDAYTLIQNLPHAGLKVIEGAGHAPQFTHPQIVADYIEKALKP